MARIKYYNPETGKWEYADSSFGVGSNGSGGNVDLGVTGATVGQIIKISTVDENGKPTAWTPVDFPSGGDLSTETWTFQLADGSVVTKEVYVK